jgi:hypothetical protein
LHDWKAGERFAALTDSAALMRTMTQTRHSVEPLVFDSLQQVNKVPFSEKALAYQRVAAPLFAVGD